MSERLHSILMRCIIAGFFLGILGMIQPFSLSLFKPGFTVLLYSVGAYIIVSHITPRSADSSSEGS
ncbi:MAG: hypothetical protein ACETWB_06810 [Anaerolineae bacterium]